MGKIHHGQAITSGFNSKQPTAYSQFDQKRCNGQPECRGTNAFKSNLSETAIHREIARMVKGCYFDGIIEKKDWKRFVADKGMRSW